MTNRTANRDRVASLPKLEAPFRNHLNQRYSKQLFYEPWTTLLEADKVFAPPFTLNVDVEDLINFGREYISDCDQTGYTTSMRLLGDYAYWDHLMKAGWFREAVADWNKEMDAMLHAEAMRKIRELAEGDDAKALQAAKWLANKEYKNNSKSKRGRPSKVEIEGATREAMREAESLQKDYERITLVSG